MNLLICALSALVLLTIPGDFAANRVFLLILGFSLILLHHYVKGRPWYFRLTEYALIASVVVVWAAGLITFRYYLLQPLINGSLTLHAISAICYYWPEDAQERKQSRGVLWKALPWFMVALLAQWKASEWIPQAKIKEMLTRPSAVMPDTLRSRPTTQEERDQEAWFTF